MVDVCTVANGNNCVVLFIAAALLAVTSFSVRFTLQSNEYISNKAYLLFLCLEIYPIRHTIHLWSNVIVCLRYHCVFRAIAVVQDRDATLLSYFFTQMNAFTNGANNYFLLFGGELRNKTFSDELWLYNASSNSWTRLRGPVPPSLRPVSQHSAAVVATPDDDTYLYVFGGRIRLDGGQFSCDLHRFSWTRQSWEFVSPDPAGLKSSAIRLAGHSMVYDEHAKLLIVFGGFGLSRTLSFRSNSLYFFNIEKNLWYKPSQTGAVPSARAFHSASILGEYMVVHGGNTHTHERDESCHSNGTFFYHLRCHEWHERRAPSDGQRGVFGHASAVAGKNLLLVHGGYDGTARSDLLVYKVPVYAIRDASLSESDKCKSHVTRADCLMNNRCGWCLLPRRTCESKRNSENACSEFSDDDRDRPPCKGLCEKLDQCVACATSERWDAAPWASERGAKSGVAIPLNFQIWHFSVILLQKKAVFLVSRRKNEISSRLTPPWQIFMVTSGKIRK